MKKRVFLAMAAALGLSVAACGSTNEDVNSAENNAQEQLSDEELAAQQLSQEKSNELNENVSDLEEAYGKVVALYEDGTIPSSQEMDTVIEQSKTVIGLATDAKSMELSDTELDDINASLDLMLVSLNSILELYAND